MDRRKIVACFIVNVWYLNIVTWLMMWFIKNHNSARRRNRQLALRNRTFVRRMVGYFNSILHGVLRLQGTLLKVPEPIPNAYPDPKWSWFENCLGALDGTYINVHVPERDKPRYRSRKGEIATNMLGVWSASDSRVLRDAISRPSGLKVPTGNNRLFVYISNLNPHFSYI
ncbi:hypothetical protein D8674_030329 [Pyrus ussuriensis x Pyrus communis]|uniref:DDE Tnp4 domain-containing protein n=1 Tax=Pyrus ussuriensis x Pyrus communis TaxID=2448454 RepID=A0A5N5EV56_9ROSA|nr:hypothetical protein D8674_030329 [Pyrus ussuriensis x Pyrus communis]